MSAQKNKKDINLLPRDEFTNTSVGIFLTWALSIGRVLVILTEIVVIGAFFSRFFLDAKITDLNDDVKRKKSILVASSGTENSFRRLQKKIGIFQTYVKQPSKSELMDSVASVLPPDVILTTVNFGSDAIVLDGLAFSESSLASYITSLRSSEKFKDVLLSQVASGGGEEVGFGFNLKLNYLKRSTK